MNNLMTIPAQDIKEQKFEMSMPFEQKNIAMVCNTLSLIGHEYNIRVLFTGSLLLNMKKLIDRTVSDIDISLESFEAKDKVLNLLSKVYSVKEFDVSMDYETAERSTDTHFRYTISNYSFDDDIVKLCLFIRKDEHIEFTKTWISDYDGKDFPMHFGGFRETLQAKLRYALKFDKSSLKHRMDIIRIMNRLTPDLHDDTLFKESV